MTRAVPTLSGGDEAPCPRAAATERRRADAASAVFHSLKRRNAVEPVTGEGARFHPCPDGLLTERVEAEETERERLDLPEVTSAAAVIDEDHERIADVRQEPRVLAVAPVREGNRVGEVERLQESVDVQRFVELGGQHLPAEEAVDIECDHPRPQPEAVAGGLEQVLAQLATEPGDGRREGMTGLVVRHLRPEQFGERVPGVQPLLHCQ